MAPPASVSWLYWLAAFLFLVAASIPIIRGETLNATFLVLAIVFFILGVGTAKRARKRNR